MKLKVQGWGGGRFHQDGREAGHKWPLRRIQLGKEKQMNHQGQSLLVMVIIKEGVLQLDGSFPTLTRSLLFLQVI